ncbi:MAG: YtxH domain-containing protein [Clostridia bacterium]
MLRELRDVLNGTYKRHARNNAVIGLVAGLAAGVIAGILFAPKTGKETRAYISEGAKAGVKKIKDTIQCAGEAVKEKHEEVVKDIKKAGKQTAANVKEAAEEVNVKVK